MNPSSGFDRTIVAPAVRSFEGETIFRRVRGVNYAVPGPPPAIGPKGGKRRWTVLWPVLALTGLGLCALALFGVATSRVGLAAMLVGATAASLPVGPVVSAFLWIDRWEPEPPRMLLTAFLWGGSGAAVTALLINDSAQLIGDAILGRAQGSVVGGVLIAPLVEEGAAGMFVLAVLIYRRQEFDGIVDGVVYAGITAAGFAFMENVFYFGRAFADGGFGSASKGILAVLVLRGVLTPFAHPLFTSMTGIGLGLASLTRTKRGAWAAGLCGYAAAVALHGLWNGAATLGTGLDFIGVYFEIMVPIFIGTLVLVLWQRRREQRIVVSQLPAIAANGWCAVGEVTMLASLGGRRGWRAAVRGRAGERAARAVSHYQTAVTELAFYRHRIAHGRAGADADEQHGALVERVLHTRQLAVRAPGALDAALAGSERLRWARRKGLSR